MTTKQHDGLQLKKLDGCSVVGSDVERAPFTFLSFLAVYYSLVLDPIFPTGSEFTGTTDEGDLCVYVCTARPLPDCDATWGQERVSWPLFHVEDRTT